MLQIGRLALKNHLIMAPMAGISNLPFRLIAKKMGAGLVTTEMVSAEGLSLKARKTLAYLQSDACEKPLAVQLFGSKPDKMVSAAQIAVEAGADIIDINMGCPAKKVLKNGSGGALLKEPETVRKIISGMRSVCPVPLTVKMRAGWSSDQMNACDMARLAQDYGADAVTIHPRFVKQGFSGCADWNIITKVKKCVQIPVIGNGDITEPEHALEMIKQTACDGIMIGRAAVGNPWIFRQIIEFSPGMAKAEPSLKEKKDLIVDHFGFLDHLIGEERAAKIMRGLLVKYTKGLPHSSRFREKITRIGNLKMLVSVLDEFCSFLEDKTL